MQSNSDTNQRFGKRQCRATRSGANAFEPLNGWRATISCTRDAFLPFKSIHMSLIHCVCVVIILAYLLHFLHSMHSYVSLAVRNSQQSENSYILVPTVSQVALSVKIGQDVEYIWPSSHCCESNYHLELLHMGGWRPNRIELMTC